MLGARIVESWADRELPEAATDAIAKIEAVIPERLRGYMANTALLAPPLHFMEPIGFDLADLRRAVRSQVQGAVRAMRRARAGERADGAAAVAGVFRAGLGAGGVVRAARRISARSGWTGSTGSRCTEEHFRAEAGKTLHDFLKRNDTWTRSAL